MTPPLQHLPAPVSPAAPMPQMPKPAVLYAGVALVSMLAVCASSVAIAVLTPPPRVEVEVVSLPEQAIQPSAGKQTMAQAIGSWLWGVDFSALATKNHGGEALSTTPIEAFDTDLAEAEQDEAFSQNLVVCNFDATDYLCVGGTTWDDTCGAGDATCLDGEATDGIVVPPGSCRTDIRLLGTERPCLVGSGDISSWQAERMTWRGPSF